MEGKHQDVEGWARARSLFLDLIELGSDDRRHELERIEEEEPALRTWVERLLEQDEGEPLPAAPRFGPYEAIRHLASGGMGEVHLARRSDGEFEREVAVKLLRPGLGSEELVQRFLRERQTLAQLDHEFIAGLLDGGTTEEGQPYLVMEYVEGEPLDRYCRERDLTVDERLALFLRVCAAVQHAHEREVIHRDLKPSNILVRADGTPRLLDFGIARPRVREDTPGEALTRTGHRLFTPEYASPEQVRGEEVGLGTDVFSLGVLLYVMLTGAHPWPTRAGTRVLEQAICEGHPPPPSRRRRGTARRLLSGDLDTITLKCLAVDPSERYASVGDLASDVERHRKGLPIRARRTSLVQRAWRYSRRKPWHLVGAVSLVLAALAGALAVVSNQSRERRELELLESVEGRIESARTEREQGRFEQAHAELVGALATLDGLPRERYLRALVHGQLAVLANHERDFAECFAQLQLAEASLPEDDPRSVVLRAILLNQEAYAYAAWGSKAKAFVAAQAALDWCRAKLEPGHELLIDALLGSTNQQRSRQEFEAALETLEEAAAQARIRGDERNEALGRVLNLTGLTLADAGRHADALVQFDEAQRILTWHFGERHPSTAIIHGNIATSLMALGQLREAEQELGLSVAALRALELEARLASNVDQRGLVLQELGEFDRAEACYREALQIRQEFVTDDHPVLWRSHYRIGSVLDDAGKPEEARPRLEAALARYHGLVMIEPSSEADARFRVGRMLAAAGEDDRARQELEGARALQLELYGTDDARTLATEALLGD